MYFRVSIQVLFISKTSQYFDVSIPQASCYIARGSVCPRNLFPFKVLNFISLTLQFLLFYVTLYIVLDMAALQLLVAQYQCFF